MPCARRDWDTIDSAVIILWFFITTLALGGEWRTVGANEWLEVSGLPLEQASWALEGNTLHARDGGAAGMQDLRSRATYGDFEFEFEFKLAPGANSGVKYRMQKVDRWQRPGDTGYQSRARGLEFQLIDDATHPDAKKGPERITGALYGILAPTRSSVPAAGVWHRGKIVVNGAMVEHWLDGECVLRFDLNRPEVAAALRKMHDGQNPLTVSPVCLQDHGGGVWFRNLRIRPGS